MAGPCQRPKARARAENVEERCIQDEDGSVRTISLSEVPVEFEGAPATLALLRDLSNERRIEKRLRLADRMTSLGSLVAGIAHELNNPMSYVLANLEMMREEAATLPMSGPRLEDFRDMLAEVEEGCLRISSTVIELQRFSHPPPAGNGGSLSQIIGSACAITGSTIRSHAKLNINIDHDAMLPEGADQLTHVLVNLLLNAAESIVSAPHGDSTNHAIDLHAFRLESPQKDLVIEVRDTGPGISEAMQERMFDPFYTTRHADRASGLGLPICYSMVSAMGGELEVQSNAEGGATLRVRLPAELGEQVAAT